MRKKKAHALVDSAQAHAEKELQHVLRKLKEAEITIDLYRELVAQLVTRLDKIDATIARKFDPKPTRKAPVKK